MKTTLLLPLLFVVLCIICHAQVPFADAPARIHQAVEKPPIPTPSFTPPGANLPAVKPVEPLIQLGQPVDDVKAVLEAKKIYVSDLPFPFPAGEKTHSFLGFTLDSDRIDAQVFYANATKRVTSIAILVRANAYKSSEGWVSAQNIRFNPDRTFDVRFAPPLEPAYETLPEMPNPAAGLLAERKPSTLIYVGQEVAAAETIMREKKIDYGSGRRAIFMHDKDSDEYSFGIDQQRSASAIYFSKTTKKITGLEAEFFPARDQSHKINQAHRSLQAVRFNQDGSYEMRFSAPLTDEERTALRAKNPPRQNVFPTSEDPGPRPQNFSRTPPTP